MCAHTSYNAELIVFMKSYVQFYLLKLGCQNHLRPQLDTGVSMAMTAVGLAAARDPVVAYPNIVVVPGAGLHWW